MPQPAPVATRTSALEDIALGVEILRVLASPVRLRVVRELCQGERHVSALLAAVDTPQPNMSQHLKVLHDAGLIARRRDGSRIHYRICSPRLLAFCDAFCALIEDQQAITGALPVADELALS